MGLKIIFPNNVTYLVLNIYCICDYGSVEALIEYKSTLADLHNIINCESFYDVILTGDFNADPFKGRFFSEISRFNSENGLAFADVANLPADSYTFISNNSTSSTSWLDHVVVSSLDLIFNIEVLYGYTFYDHVPLLFNLRVPNAVTFASLNANFSHSFDNFFVDWENLSPLNKEMYSDLLDELSINLLSNSLSCYYDSCDSDAHKNSLNELYNDILDCIVLASDCLPLKSNIKFKGRVVGWNKYCRDLYANARCYYMIWHDKGKVRSGVDFANMKNSRTLFKNALNYCKKNELKIRKENLLQKFASGNKSNFWRAVSNIKGGKVQDILSVDNMSDKNEIVSIFDDKYKCILNDSNCRDSNRNFFQRASNGFQPCYLLQDDIDSAILQLNDGLGWDGVHANHLKYSGPVFR